MKNTVKEKLILVASFLPITIVSSQNDSSAIATEILPKPLPLASPERSAIDHANFNVSSIKHNIKWAIHILPFVDGSQLSEETVFHSPPPCAKF